MEEKRKTLRQTIPSNGKKGQIREAIRKWHFFTCIQSQGNLSFILMKTMTFYYYLSKLADQTYSAYKKNYIRNIYRVACLHIVSSQCYFLNGLDEINKKVSIFLHHQQHLGWCTSLMSILPDVLYLTTTTSMTSRRALPTFSPLFLSPEALHFFFCPTVWKQISLEITLL